MKRRILHVVSSMSRGGIESWLIHVLRAVDRESYQMDFLVQTDQPQAYDEEIRDLGGQIIPCLDHRKPWRFARSFAKALSANGPYDIVHSHTYYYTGYVLWVAARQGVPVRIAHSHNDKRADEARRGWLWRSYCEMMRLMIRRNATAGVAASQEAAEALFGSSWRLDQRFRVMYCGIDLEPFYKPHGKAKTRRSVGLPADALVIGHVGRFSSQKNHRFIVEIASQMLKSEPRARLLLVGDGPLRGTVEAQVHALDIADRVVFAGLRDDVPQLMLGAMDVFLFPSHYEGLGLVLLEAQAAGLPCVLSDHLPREVDVVSQLVHRLPLDASPMVWAKAVARAASERTVSQHEAACVVAASSFNIDKSVDALLRVYDESRP
jgi:glycosyltransferase involved in cell wall biosynthesis